jgi:hypothetical protein
MHSSTGTTDEQGHAGLDGRRIASLLHKPVTIASKGHGLPGKELAQHDHRLLEPIHPHTSGVERQTGAAILGLRVTGAQAELGTDFWQLGRWWGDQVARKWEATVWGSLVRVRDEAERGTATGRRDRKGR